MVGSKSEAFFHHTAKALADALPTAEYESLEGAHHGSPEMSPGAIAARIIERFGRLRRAFRTPHVSRTLHRLGTRVEFPL